MIVGVLLGAQASWDIDMGFRFLYELLFSFLGNNVSSPVLITSLCAMNSPPTASVSVYLSVLQGAKIDAIHRAIDFRG
jgi:hypothetical protein